MAKIKMPSHLAIGTIKGELLLKNGRKKVNGTPIDKKEMYLCWIDLNKNEIKPLRIANKNEL